MSQRNISSRYWLAAGYLALLSLLAGCDSKIVAGGGNKRPSPVAQPQATQPAPVAGGGESKPWGVPVPTAIHYGVQCPGATSAEIKQAQTSNKPWICYAATREAAE